MDNQADRMKGYRYIAPRHVEPQVTQGSSMSQVEEGKTKRASMACLECKKRRTKCSTEKPCSECAAHDRQCVYDETADKRRKEHAMTTKNLLSQTQEFLRYYHKLLEDLLESFRLGDGDQLNELVQVIQNTVRNESFEEQGIYLDIEAAIESILAEYEDAPGSVVDMGQEDMIS